MDGETFKDHVAGFQVTVVHSHLPESFGVKDIFCGSGVDEDLLYLTLVDPLSSHADIEDDECYPGLLI